MGIRPLLNTSNCILILFYSTLFCSFGQNYKDFAATDNIDKKCRIAEKLALDYVVSDLDSLRMLGEELLRYSNKKYSKKGINTSYFLIGNYLIRTAKEQEGMVLLRKSKNYYLSIEDFDKVTEILNEIGNAYQYMGNYKEACKRYEKSLVYGELASDEHVKDMAKINLAQAQNALGKYDLAKENAEEYRDWVLKLGSLQSSSNAFAVLGSIELNRGKNKQAIYYFEQCYKFAVRAGDNAGKGHAYTNIGIVKYLQEQMDESERYFREALEFRKNVRNVSLICDAYLNYGGILFEREKYESAIHNYQKGLNLAREHKKYINEIELLEALKELYTDYDLERLGDINKALEIAEKNKSVQEENQKQIDEVLAGELRESDRIRKSGFVNESDKWPFYAGAVILFIGFLFLAIRKKII